MKTLRTIVIGLAVTGMVVFLSSASFAEMAPAAGKDSSAWKAKHEARMKLLQDSAAALQQANPDLAKKLSDLANGETSESKEKLAKDSPEWKARHEARMQLYKDAAAALSQTHPDLAKGLEEMTVAKPKIEMQKATGEKVEPNPVQAETK